jgi:DNA-binding phage protein
MAMTKELRETVKKRARNDREFREALLVEAVNAYLDGDEATGKTLLREAITATVGFDQLEADLNRPSKSLNRMFGPRGNPNTASFFETLQALQKKLGVKLIVRAQ